MPPVRHRLPGRIFWLHTLALAVLSPTAGKRRIDAGIQKIEQEREETRIKNDALVCENIYLREELYRLQGDNNLFRVQDEMNSAIGQEKPHHHAPSWACPDMETTVSMPRPNPITTCPN